MIHQQPGGLASQLRGSAAQPSPALPPAALAGPAASLTQHQTGSKRAQHADVHPGSHPGSATAAVTAAGDVSNGKGIGAGVSVSNSKVQSTSTELQKPGGMSWNPVRLSSPFEKASEPAGNWLATQNHLCTTNLSVCPPLPPQPPPPRLSNPSCMLRAPPDSTTPPSAPHPPHLQRSFTICVLLSQ